MKHWPWLVASCRAKAVFATLLRAGRSATSHTLSGALETSNELSRVEGCSFGQASTSGLLTFPP